MVFDVLALALLVVVFLHARRRDGNGFDPALLPAEDRPPVDADDPLPGRHRLRRYAGDGLADLEDYLAGRDRTG